MRRRITFILSLLILSLEMVHAQKYTYFTEETEEGVRYGYKDNNGDSYCSVYMIGTLPDPYVSGLRRITKEGKIGFVNKKGVIVIPPIYDQAEQFSKKICVVNIGAQAIENSATDVFTKGKKEGGLWGVINKKGETILPCAFTRIKDGNTGEYEYKKGVQIFTLSPKGKIIFKKIASREKQGE